MHLKKSTMHRGSESVFPIVDEIDGFIYALFVPPVKRGNLLDAVFEVYDPCADKWTHLQNPPFLWIGIPYSYVVVGKKLCVSTWSASCAFDTSTGDCEAYELFLDHDQNGNVDLRE